MQSNRSQGNCLGTIALAIRMLFAVVMLAGLLVPAQAQTFPLAFPTPTTFATGPCCPSTVSVVDRGLQRRRQAWTWRTLTTGSNLNVMLGKGDGTFQVPITQNLATSNIFYEAITAGDFNGDHVLDIAIWTHKCNHGFDRSAYLPGHRHGQLYDRRSF